LTIHKSPTHFAYYHMHPTDNGRGSRQRLLLQRSFKLPSQAHSEKSMLPQSHHLQLSGHTRLFVLLLFKGFVFIKLYLDKPDLSIAFNKFIIIIQ